MTKGQIEESCKEKEQEILKKYFGKLVKEAAIKRPEKIEHYTPDLPLKIEAEYRAFLEKLWNKVTPKGTPLVLDEQKLRKLMTDDDREGLNQAYKKAIRRTLWERITRTNHKDVTYYKGWLEAYTKDLLMVMRNDFLEEITGKFIKNKTFEDD